MAIDFNHKVTLSEKINSKIDDALKADNRKQKPRNYLGGSRLGVECERSLQYEYFNAPKDPGKEFTGRTLRIFRRGFWAEDMMIEWMRNSGFDLRTHDEDGHQFGFSTLNGSVRGHCDGVILKAPGDMKCPMLWECKCVNQNGWKKLVREGLKKAYPTYYAQVMIYQKYFELTENPALFSACNANDMSIHWELVEHDESHADILTNKAKRIILSCQHGELLPKQFHDKSYYKCKWCNYSERCYKND